MTTKYKTEVFTYIFQNKQEIENIANQIGISKEALAGAVAEEYNSIKNSLGIGDRIGESWAQESHQKLLDDYNQLKLSENKSILLNPNPIDKFKHPTLNDIGPGNIKLSTAIDLLNNYIVKNPNSDPLSIKPLAKDYSLLAQKLINPEDNTTFKFAGLMLKEGQDFYLANSPNVWRSLEQSYQDAVLVTYYNLGKEKALNNLNNFKLNNPNIEYSPRSGSGGDDHIANASLLKTSLENNKLYLNENGDLFLLDDHRKMKVILSENNQVLSNNRIQNIGSKSSEFGASLISINYTD